MKVSLNLWNTRQTWTERVSGKDLPFLPVDQKRARAIENDTLGFCFPFFLFSPMITPKQFLECAGGGTVTYMAVDGTLSLLSDERICVPRVCNEHTQV